MNTPGTRPRSKREAEFRAEASAWLARLHGPNRTVEVEAGFRAWLSESAEHAAAFEHMTDTWEKAARLRRRPTEHLASWELPGMRVSFSRAAMVIGGVAGLAIASTLFYLSSDTIVTSIGEQRILTLDDGSRVYLNTATRAVVRYDETARRVELNRGEALFDVAKRPDRPFIVIAGERQIRALGTSFIVRKEDQHIEITLVEGKISVMPTPQEEKPDSNVVQNDSFMLVPGQRLTLDSHDAPRLDRPALDKMTAWQRGQVALDDVPLRKAVAEMNRYSRVQLVVDSPRAANIRISGIFRAGDSSNFAQAISRTYDLTIVNEDRTIILVDTSPLTAEQ